jgi:hypothetical protein
MKPFCLQKGLRSPACPTETPDAVSDPNALITRTREQAIQAVDEIACGLCADVRQDDASFLEWYWQQLGYHFNVARTATYAARHAAAPPPAAPATEPAVLGFVAGSMFLANCWAYLTSHPKRWERMYLVTGQKLSATRRTLDLMSKVALSEQSTVGAVADPLALKQALSAMESWGHALQGLFHSHPGQGALATRPSSIDFDTHERFERGGVPLVGCIFVRDGHLRFFRHSSDPFTITITGTGIVPINEAEHVYKIQNPGAARVVSYETFATEEAR